MKKRWIYKHTSNHESIVSLSKSINVNPYLAKILVQNGIQSYEDAKAFFRPSLERLHDPFLMKDMDEAVNRLCEAVSNQEKILLYGDYDVDGTTAVSLMYLFLRKYTCHVDYYVPDRHTEGYGLSLKGVDWAHTRRFPLIIALDCGIQAIEQADRARSYGIDLIVCDHHLPGHKLPNALAILDPKRSGCRYPFKELSGCGIGFKLLEGFCQQNTIEKKGLFEFLDFLAVSIASDLVPITGENRILTFHGLRKLNQNPSAGLQSLKEASGIKQVTDISDVVFRLGPRINAAGRLAHADESVKLLIGEREETRERADVLNARNAERKKIDRHITDEALKMIASQPQGKKSTVLFKKDWHKGVIGIVASRCIERYYRPTIILTESSGKAVGSARSVEGFDIHKALMKCQYLLEKFGGHKYAAGLTLVLDNVALFQERFEEVVARTITEEELIPKIYIDTEFPLEHVNFKTSSVIQQMGPFGPENLAPTFITKNVVVKSPPRILKEKHIKGFLFEKGSSRSHEFIGFGLATKAEQIIPERPFHVAYHIEENIFMHQKSLILNLKDVQFD